MRYPFLPISNSVSKIRIVALLLVVPSLLFFTGPLCVRAQETQQSFSDVPLDHWAYGAVEYLKEKGIIQGYSDGTFKPDKGVNRAEAAKIIIAPLVSAEELAVYAESVFDDIPRGTWFLPYVEVGRQRLNVIDGPPKKTAFKGESPVLKVEFFKMLLLAHKIDPVGSYNEIKLPLSSDVANPDEWFYPYVRYAITASMTMIGQDGLLQPGKQLSRGEVAALTHRFLMYKEGRRTQALLSETESEIVILLKLLEQNDVVQAEYASARALLAARGALTSRPDASIVKAAMKTAEGFRTLVRGYRAGVEKRYQEVVDRSKEAWNLAAKAIEFDAGMQNIATQMQEIASKMADEARAFLNAVPE